MTLQTQSSHLPFTPVLGAGMTHYVARVGDDLKISTCLADLLTAYPQLAEQPKPDDLSHFLHRSLIPYPHTIYPRVWAVGVGDTAVFAEDGPPTLTNAMPYLPENHLPTTQPASTQRLRDLLVASVREKLGRKKAALMLSSGKDSVGLALALKAAGLEGQVEAFTYAEDGANSEAEVAAHVAAKVGMKHHVVPLPTAREDVRAAMIRFFNRSAQPVADPVAPAYIMALHQAQLEQGVLMDGTGNDIYMGMLPPRKQGWYRYGVGAWNIADWIARLVPFESPLNKFLRPPADGPILGRLALRQPETSQLFESVPTNPYWRALGQNPVLQDEYQRFFQHMRGYYYDGCHTTRVREEIAHAGNNKLVLPYVDEGLYAYFRQLAVRDKYDLPKGKNKLLLRALLLEDLDYDADRVGKRIFSFNQQAFLQTHRAFVEEEIMGCALWGHKAEPLVRTCYETMPRVPAVRYGLMQLFLLAGWYNHSMYLKVNG